MSAFPGTVKRILALALCLILVVTTLPLSVFAEELGDGELTTEEGELLPEEGEEEEPGQDVDIYADPVDVSTADELEEALAEKTRAIRITADIILDRTFYVTANAAIFTEESHALTRAHDFGGDLFVVGEEANGTICEEAVTLTLGHADSTEKDFLIIDGNRDNMTVDVVGSALFIVGGATADVYENVTMRNHYKVGNEKTLTGNYGVSYVEQVGGAVAIVSAKATMNIYGGTYVRNAASDVSEGVSSQGAVIYNYGKLYIYGGTFEDNYAARGPVVYCYRTTYIYNAVIRNNSASSLGGAVYMPASTGAFLYLGGENDYADSRVVFEGNTSAGNGGAIYAQNKLEAQDTQFINNSTTTGTGGAIHAAKAELVLTNTVFDGNTAKTYGGAVCETGVNSKDDVPEITGTDVVFKNNRALATGGAIYMNKEASAYLENADFINNTAQNNGGAVYLNAAYLDINGGTIKQNSSSTNGGALTAVAASSIRFNEIDASQNTAKYGGFVYCEAESTLYGYDSTLAENRATSQGGAVYMITGSNGGIYNTTFHKNTCTNEGGALYIYLYGTEYEAPKMVLHSNTYTENEANNGGAIYTAKQSTIDLYNSVAKKNNASKGGFLYHTAFDTVVNLASLILEGNTATDGPIIFGNTYNADLYLDKALYIDRDYTGDLDDAYWATAIANKLTYHFVVIDIPNYIGYMGEEVVPVLPRIPVDVATADELEAVLADGKDLIHITADFAIDRTFYIRRNTTIYTTEAHILTRAAGFGGDMFVVGELPDGTACENAVTLTLGDPESKTKNLLVIDGNKDNVTVDVTGSVLFVVGGATADLYENVTIRNHHKIGNEKTLTGNYGVSYVEQVGGAVAIVSAKAAMNIYGGTYAGNSVSDVAEGVSSQGAVIYNFGTLSIYGGTFEDNYAARGSVVYCYRKTYIYNAVIRNNSASSLGGAVYMPASTGAFLYLGGENEVADSRVVFEGNSAPSGGAIYAQNKLEAQDTQFINNSATTGTGGAIHASKVELVLTNTVFDGNTAKTYGGAVYETGVNSKDDVPEITGTDVVFKNNSVSATGGAIYMNKEAEAVMENVEFTANTAPNNGGAVYLNNARIEMTNATITGNGGCANGGAAALTAGAHLEINGGTISQNTATAEGGAIALYASATAVLNKVTAVGNQGKNGGFAYVEDGALLTMYRSRIEENVSTLNGGAIALYDGGLANIYATDFIKNTTQGSGNGGALFLYTDTAEVLVHSCTFTENNAAYGGAIYASNKAIAKLYNLTATGNTATRGGFLYETTTGTTLTLVGLTVSGNTAADGGPIIWGNSTGAVLYIDKTQVTDRDHSGALNSAYWSAAIVNKLKVYDISESIPKWLDYREEAYDHLAHAVDVSTADQLEAAILSGASAIRIIADITVDRTFYITGKTTIFSTLPRTLKRAPDFGGDIFVVGENQDGKSALLLGGNAKLVLGNPLSTRDNMLIIDGNDQNMTVPVVGSALFICHSASVDLHQNVTAQNMHKTGNERTFNEVHHLPIANRVGGTLAVVASGSLNIYGGLYQNNRINEEDTSSEETRNSSVGGLIFNKSNVYIHGGVFRNNEAARGGVVYSYGILKIYGGSFIENVATVSGGVIYTPNTASSHTHIGNTDENGAAVLFQNNVSVGHGGAIASSALCALVIHGNTMFAGNISTGGSGGAISSYGQLTVRDTVFSGNASKSHGGAVYVSNSSASYITRYSNFVGCTFENNVATTGGALAVYASNSGFENGAIATVTDCKFTANTAASTASKSTKSYGGAIYVERRSSLTVKGTNFKQNTARTEGGAVYAGGASTVSLTDTVFDRNAILENGNHGGAVAIHSVTLTAEEVTFKGNTAGSNGGALYVSYASAHDRNSEVLLKDSTFSSNSTEDLGGALYVTKQTVETEKRILTVQNTSFTSNSATQGGAMYFVSGTDAYMTDTTFSKNEATDGAGGAIYSSGAELELDTATFTQNTSTGSGAALHLKGQGKTTLYAVTATGNATESAGGFLYAADCTLTVYDSVLTANTAKTNGGSIALYGGASANIYNTQFNQNIAEASGGGMFLYTNEAPCVLHTCTFTGNVGNYGGAIYASNKTTASLYNLTATANESQKGGFLYETTTGTTLTLVGATVSGNTAAAGGPVIWGNSAGAVLRLDKSQFNDEDRFLGILGDSYWEEAITNALTVEEITAQVPDYDPYESKRVEDPTTPATKEPVPVQELFTLAAKTSNTVISGSYSKLPRLDNSSNFMSKNVTTFENINGGNVTVDTFVYSAKDTEDNCNVGMGLLIWQAMCYKQAHPEEDVYIDTSSYRFSVQTAVNISRTSRYFGYMRLLTGTDNYDKLGFVRIAYLLTSAAKMGIHVNVIGHIDAYPTTKDSLQLYDYFTTQLNDPCDPKYVQDGVIGDYLDFTMVDWTLQNKGGTDMMHNKMCAVSHYLDMNGVVHKNAVWSSSTNLDGINAAGQNGNWKQQTATIVSDHEALYKTAVNYLRLIPQYQEQEEIYEFQAIVNRRSTQQSQLILAGRENEIPDGEQIIYLGRDTDKVFELYFTPMGGDILSWDEVHNPYCKYLRKLYDSEDYILFTWNAAEYNGEFALGRQIEEMIIAAFHDNRNVNNRIYGNMENFDASSFDDLTVGVDIGAKSFNQLDFGQIHNKDVQFSYVEDGQRYYVSLMNSMNFHSGSMYYQSNFALVIKETECSEDSVFFTLADLTTKDIVDHNYGPEQTHLPDDMSDGYTYKACQDCGKIVTTGIVHRPGEWIVVREATAAEKGIQYKACVACGVMLESREYRLIEGGSSVTLSDINGKTFTADTATQIPVTMTGMPHTLEATIRLSPKTNGRGGVIVGNYDAVSENQVNLEIHAYGKVRLYYTNGGIAESCIFNTDIRSEDPTHIAVTINGLTATLYVNGEAVETATLTVAYPESAENFVIGGDRRASNPYYFRGTIYSVSLFGDVRTEQEVAKDAVLVTDDADALLYTDRFSTPYVGKITVGEAAGKLFNEMNMVDMGELSETPHTMEAEILLSKDQEDYAGVIMGTDADGKGKQMYLEVVENGLPRLILADGEKQTAYTFTTDIRSDSTTHIALTIADMTITLYVNGEIAEVLPLSAALPEVIGKYVLGGNSLTNSTAYFTGKIYSASLFADARTQEQIKQDMIWVGKDTEGLLYTGNFVAVGGGETSSGITFKANGLLAIEKTFSQAPRTIEATVRVPKTMSARAGVILGNYKGGNEEQLNLEVYYNGQLRLFYVSGGQKAECLFTTDIRSNTPKHIAVTVEGLLATLYVDGAVAEIATLSVAYTEATDNFVVGGDNRIGNTQYFKGTLYSVALFSDVRTAEEIAADAATLPVQDDHLLYADAYSTGASEKAIHVYDVAGKEFVSTEKHEIDTLADTPHTIEALVQLSESVADRGGVIVGNYDSGNGEQLNLEVYTKGRIRLFYIAEGKKVSAVFATDIRSETPKHIAVCVDGSNATLYVDGLATETVKISSPYAAATENFVIGGDNRYANAAYFKGKIYSVSLFADVRTPEQIRRDSICVNNSEPSLLYTTNYVIEPKTATYTSADGKTFSTKEKLSLTEALSGAPHTIEATVLVPKSTDDRAGVIVGNYIGGATEQLNLEIYTYGRLRLFYIVGGQRYDHVFETDIRSDKPVHVAVVVNGTQATLYVDGAMKENAMLSAPLPEVTENFVVGGDNRVGNFQYFKGKLYSVSLFADARTSAEILKDIGFVAADAPDALYVKYFTAPECSANIENGVHTESDWIVDHVSTETESGVMHTQCEHCGVRFKVAQMGKSVTDGKQLNYQTMEGMSFSSAQETYPLSQALQAKPLTIEATIGLSKSYSSRAGVVFGNYDNSTAAQVNLEIYTNGQPRLYTRIGSISNTYQFTTDVRSDSQTHIAVTMDGLTANLYVNGVWKESVTMKRELPDAVNNYCVGGDNRTDNTQHFKGVIYSVSVFSDVRTAEEIACDAYLVSDSAQGILYNHYFVTDEAK